MFRKDLLNLDLWIGLLINPDYNHDRIILEKTAYLHTNKFFNIFGEEMD